jgi:hypothetical protein
MTMNAGGHATKRVTIAIVASTDNAIFSVCSVSCKNAGSLAADEIYPFSDMND